ncbi:MAG TPA: metallophosphoesterase [Gemmatimonadales bacterium]|nr:metallophosphoesterase [Gemmatimonadales bacterium]
MADRSTRRLSPRRRRLLRRVVAILASWLGVPWLVVSAFLAAVVPGGWLTLLGLLGAVLVAVGVRVGGFFGKAYAGRALRTLLFIPLYYVILFLPLLAIAALLGALVGWPLGLPLEGGRAAIEVTAALLALLAIAGYWGASRLVVREVEVRHPKVPAAFDGLRIVQLSDLHVGPQTGRAFLARIRREVERVRPDLIAFTGDMVDDYPDDAARFVAEFGSLSAPLGSFAVAGNHDVYAGWNDVAATIRAAGVEVLENRGVVLRRGESAIWIGGTGDPAAIQMGSNPEVSPAIPDLDRTMADAPADAFRLVLAHNPALWEGLVARGADLTLSGHTHHGQLSVPSLQWCLASPFLKYAMGRHALGAAILYISPGTNYWGIPFRLGAWPEVTVVRLSAVSR